MGKDVRQPIDYTSIEAIKEAEGKLNVRDYLEIMEDSPDKLKIRIHNRAYAQKITLGNVSLHLFISLFPAGFSIILLIFAPEIGKWFVLGASAIFIPAFLAILDSDFRVIEIVVQNKKNTIIISRFPFFVYQTVSILHVAGFSKTKKEKFSVHLMWKPGLPVNKSRHGKDLFISSYNESIVNVVIARLNRVLYLQEDGQLSYCTICGQSLPGKNLSKSGEMKENACPYCGKVQGR